MRRFVHRLANYHDYIYKILIFVVACIAIVLIIPKEGKFKYEFQKGKRWVYNDLYAPFDFGIIKTKDEKNEEKNYIISNTRPFYKEDSAIIKKVVTSFVNEFEAQSNLIKIKKQDKSISDIDVVQANKDFCRFVIDTIYKLGFVEVNPKYKSNFVTVIRRDVAEDINIGDFLIFSEVNDLLNKQLGSVLRHFKTKYTIDTVFTQKILQNLVVPTVFYDEETTNKVIEQDIQAISPTKGLKKKGLLLINKGAVINEERFQMLNSLKYEFEQIAGYSFSYSDILLGYLILVVASLFVLMLFLRTFRRDIFNQTKLLFFLFSMVFVAVLAARIVLKMNLPIYFVPFCILPIIIRVFFDTRLALFLHLVTMLIIGNIVPNAFEFIFLQIITGIVAIISVVNFRTRSHLFLTSFIIFIIYCFVYSGMSILQEGTYQNIRVTSFVWFGVNAFLTLFAYPLMYMLERIFGFVSDIKLLELSDTNNKLLRELAEKAPGTFQHSLQVANLAEEAIYQIGGNALMVRTGALYHDIGKMDMPLFFIENQVTGINPHDEISFDESAKIIISHVIKGIEKARKYGVPEPVIDFIRTHHGSSKVQYFYQSFLNDYPEEAVDESAFSYKGPIPYSRETAVLMMADSIEAASRSLKITSPESIDKLIDDIIATQMRTDQFINADLTFKDITKIKKIFKKRLVNSYHVRIEYPSA